MTETPATPATSAAVRGGRRRAAREVISLAWKADRRRSVLAFGIFGLQAVFAALFAYWLKLLLDGVAAESMPRVMIAGGLLAVSIGAEVVLDYTGSRVRQSLNEKAHHLVEKRLIAVVGRTPTLTIHETPAHLTQLELLDDESWEFGDVIPALLSVAQTLIRSVGVGLLLASVHPLLLLLPLFGAPIIVFSRKTNDLFMKGNELAASPQRRASDLYDLATRSESAKEIRLFGLGAEIVRRFHREFSDVRRIHFRVHLEGEAITFATRTFFLLGYLGAMVFVVDLAIRGQVSVGDVVLTAVLCGQVLGLVHGSTDSISWALRCLTTASRFVYLEDVAARERASIAGPGPSIPSRLSTGLVLEEVSYTYPNGVTALSDVSLTLPAGATVAVVGDNGAGKTTLVKLLAGLYRPSQGRILLDEVDLSALDPETWRWHVAAGFQDHARTELTVLETVGIGDLPAGLADSRVIEALSRAGADDLIPGLPSGLSTQLGPQWPGGIDLSGGQWQKLAIARAMMRTRPLLLLLDEPTAALDAETEHRLFTRWTSAAHAVRKATGAVTVLVSHRFSTVRMADLIVVVEGGRIAEVGTHESLMDARGLYAELYELQASSYR